MKPYRNRKLLDAARDVPCIRCGKEGETRACHYTGWAQHKYGKGRGQKCSDLCIAFFCQSCDSQFSEGKFSGSDKILASDEFHHWILMSLIIAAERGLLG